MTGVQTCALPISGEIVSVPEISLKLDDIAASIGLRAETISRYLSKLEKEGYIKRVGNGKILVLFKLHGGAKLQQLMWGRLVSTG